MEIKSELEKWKIVVIQIQSKALNSMLMYNVMYCKYDGPSFCYSKGQTRGSYKVLTGNSSRKEGEMGELYCLVKTGEK